MCLSPDSSGSDEITKKFQHAGCPSSQQFSSAAVGTSEQHQANIHPSLSNLNVHSCRFKLQLTRGLAQRPFRRGGVYAVLQQMNLIVMRARE